MHERRDLDIVLTRNQLFNLHRTAQAFDLNKGGCFDSRSGCVNCWASPEDKPACFDVPIEQGALKYPRELVGSLYFTWTDDNTVSLWIEQCCYAMSDSDIGRRARKLTPEQIDGLLDWTEAKVQELVRLSALCPDVGGLKCPCCNYVLPVGRLFNELIDHIQTVHPGFGLRGITLGDGIVLDGVDGSVRIQEEELWR